MNEHSKVQYPYESELKNYSLTHKEYPGKTLFERANDLGYDPYLIRQTEMMLKNDLY